MTTICRYLAWGGVLLALLVATAVKSYIKGVDDTENRITAQSEKRLAQANEYAATLQAQLDASLNHTANAVPALTLQVTHVVNSYIPSPGAPVQERPTYMLDAGSVLLWNCGLSGADPATCLNQSSMPAASASSSSGSHK